MELTYENTTHIGLGHATHTDAFQCGREAAQIAKSQIPAQASDLVLAFCPNGIRFKDFIEGVRLVTGEEKLLGLPVSWVISNDISSPDACFVLVLQLSSMHFTLASSKEEPVGPKSDITHFLTQCRQGRGNVGKMFDRQGYLVFENRDGTEADKEELAGQLAADAGLDTWLVGISPYDPDHNPLICRNQTLAKGLAGVEFFSNTGFGIGSVETGAFSNKVDILREAAKSSLRDAQAQMGVKAPALGLVFLDLPEHSVSRDTLQDIFQSMSALAHNTPLIMLPTRNQFSRLPHRSTAVNKGSVITFLVPQ